MAHKNPSDDRTARTVDAIILVASEVGFDGKQWKIFAEELNNRGVTTVTGKPFNSESLRSFCKRNDIDFTKIRMAPDLPRPSDPEGLTIMRLESKGELLREVEDWIHPVVKTILSHRDTETAETGGNEDYHGDVVEHTTIKDAGSDEPLAPREVSYTTAETPTEQITVRFDDVERYDLPHITTTETTAQEEAKVEVEPEVLPPWLEDRMDSLRELLDWWDSRQSVPTDVLERRPTFKGETRNSGIRCNVEIMKRAVEKAKEEKYRTGGNLSQLLEWLMWKYIGEPADLVGGAEETE